VRPISADLDKLKLELLRPLPASDAAREAWVIICGSSVAAKTGVIGLDAGVLTVKVPSREWRSELEGLRAHYLQRFAQICPVPIKDLRFICD
jgi:hypothetical protein